MDEVSVKEPQIFGKGNKYRIVALDCGIKHNMIRNLVKVDNIFFSRRLLFFYFFVFLQKRIMMENFFL